MYLIEKYLPSNYDKLEGPEKKAAFRKAYDMFSAQCDAELLNLERMGVDTESWEFYTSCQKQFLSNLNNLPVAHVDNDKE
jgi:hypothetical protein